MDEPTNHLDMDMRQALTIALQGFGGAILLISHDRHLLANTVDEFLIIDEGKLSRFNGDLEDYMDLAATGLDKGGDPIESHPGSNRTYKSPNEFKLYNKAAYFKNFQGLTTAVSASKGTIL